MPIDKEEGMKCQLAETTWMEYDDVGQGPVVVLLHAFPLSRAMWRPQREALAAEYRLILPDLRGFGGTSGFENDPSVVQMADDVARLLDSLKISEPVVLGGLSMGGYVALAFARKHGRRLRGLILADTRAEADSPESRAARDKTIAFAEANSASAVIDQLMPKMISTVTARSRPEIVDEIRRLAGEQSCIAIVQALRALRDRPDAVSYLPHITAPTLVMVGSEDVLTPPSIAQGLASKIPKAQLAIISGAGHLSNLEQADSFNEKIGVFLRSLS